MDFPSWISVGSSYSGAVGLGRLLTTAVTGVMMQCTMARNPAFFLDRQPGLG
jgi:hypothetical protein